MAAAFFFLAKRHFSAAGYAAEAGVTSAISGFLSGSRPSHRMPLPLLRPPHTPRLRGLHIPHPPFSPLLPWPPLSSPFPPAMPYPTLIFPLLAIPRTFSSSATSCTEGDESCSETLNHSSDSEPDAELCPPSPDAVVVRAPLPEVERVCKVISDLFSSDRAMESALSGLSVALSPALVADVLHRFRQAHRPAYRFFRWAETVPGFSHDHVTYNKMLEILGKTRQFESMAALLAEMGKARFLSMDSFKIAIKAYASAREMKKSLSVFQLMKDHGFKSSLESFNCLIEALAKAKLGKEANSLFEKMRDQYPPDLKTYTVLLLGWCNVKNLVEAGKLWNEILEKGFQPDVVVHNTMIEGLIRGQRRPEAMKMFELMKTKGPEPNARTYTIIINELCKRGKMDLAQRTFDEMLQAGCSPDVATYTCLIVGYGNAKRMDKVSGLLGEMKGSGCLPDSHTYNALIKLMTNQNMPDDAARIYRRMIKAGIEPSIHTYNMMMKSYFLSGNNYRMGCEFWEEMLQKGICPDVNSYTVFINGHIKHGRPEEACKYIEEMVKKGMKAPQIDYNKFAADFSRAGNPNALYELAQKMNFSGKFDAANVFHGWAERMKNRVKKRQPNQTGAPLF